MVRCLEAQVGKGLVVGATHLAVDLHEACDRITCSAWIQFVDHLVEESIAHLKIVRRVFRLLLLRENYGQCARNVVTCTVLCKNYRHCIWRHVPSERIERKQAGLPTRHGPCAKCLIANTHSRFSPSPGHIEGRQVGHSEIKVMLL